MAWRQIIAFLKTYFSPFTSKGRTKAFWSVTTRTQEGYRNQTIYMVKLFIIMYLGGLCTYTQKIQCPYRLTDTDSTCTAQVNCSLHALYVCTVCFNMLDSYTYVFYYRILSCCSAKYNKQLFLLSVAVAIMLCSTGVWNVHSHYKSLCASVHSYQSEGKP